KAKGLEFPVVILPGVHQGARTPRKGPSVQHDWSSGCYGVSLGAQRNLGSVLVGNKMAAREEAEQRRLLYVGMTRARDLLVLSGGLVRKPGRDAVLGLLQEAVGSEAVEGAGADIEVGAARITRTIVPATMTNRRRPRKAAASSAAPALPALIERYAIREVRRTESRSLARQLTPSRMQDDRLAGQVVRSRERKTEGDGRFVGICAHALLERWDFSVVTPPRVTELEWLCRQIVPPEADCLEAVRDDLASLMSSFLSSECYRRLQGAEILGREIPFIIPWQEGQVMEGVIDLMYRLNGRLWIADYKTDQVAAAEAQARAQQYAQQADVYRAAAAHCLGGEAASFECVFLRPAVRVEL
ncbi:MAG: ATP-binding domain-containing protein, partial [Nitrospira sp.]|nr:ATP-binding domain-containing protein [Nitrospira sp.]